jgi:hypothetical protein
VEGAGSHRCRHDERVAGWADPVGGRPLRTDLRFTRYFGEESGAQETYNLVEVRTGDEGSRNRVVFEFAGPVPPWDVTDDSDRVVVYFDGDVRGPASTDFKSTVVGSVNRDGANSWLIEGVTAIEDTSELTGPARVVIDF